MQDTKSYKAQKTKEELYWIPQTQRYLARNGIQTIKTIGKTDWDLVTTNGAKIEVKTFNVLDVAKYNMLSIELTNIYEDGWFFTVDADYIIISIADYKTNEILRYFTLDFLKFKEYVEFLLWAYYGEGWKCFVTRGILFEDIDNKDMFDNNDLRIKFQDNTAGTKIMLFIKNIYNEELTEITHWQLKDFVVLPNKINKVNIA